MIKVDVISGFLGAGKTTLIKSLYEQAFKTERVVLIENEFGEIGIDGAFLKDSGVEIKEINSGCICCSLVGDFSTSMKEVVEKFNPERIIIEPSGVGKLSDILKAVEKVDEDLKVNVVVTVVDGGKCKMYHKNFGEFYNDQVENAKVVVMSKTEKLTEEKVLDSAELIREINSQALIVTTPVAMLDGVKLLKTFENITNFAEEVMHEHSHCGHCHNCHDEDGHDGDCCHGHHEEHEHHHHEHDENCTCGCHGHDHDDHHCHSHGEENDHHHCHEHGDENDHHHCHGHHEEHEHHHHEHDENCTCGCHGHDHEHHHHDHHADEVFTSWGVETAKAYSKDELDLILQTLCDENADLGVILRSKGIVKAKDNQKWYYFDLVSGEYEIRVGEPDYTGKLCVIGSKLDQEKIEKLFLKD
ncbi:MAG: cobalamin biosynthesis protein CobW [Clostridiales bacterium]|nr:cobalamin biosynthesis protein CobW [Clostridiales bacterium]